MVQSLWEIVGHFFRTLNIEFPEDSENSFIIGGIYPRELKEKKYVYIKTYTEVLIATLFIIVTEVEAVHMSISQRMD